MLSSFFSFLSFFFFSLIVITNNLGKRAPLPPGEAYRLGDTRGYESYTLPGKKHSQKEKKGVLIYGRGCFRESRVTKLLRVSISLGFLAALGEDGREGRSPRALSSLPLPSISAHHFPSQRVLATLPRAPTCSPGARPGHPIYRLLPALVPHNLFCRYQADTWVSFSPNQHLQSAPGLRRRRNLPILENDYLQECICASWDPWELDNRSLCSKRNVFEFPVFALLDQSSRASAQP